MTRGKNPFAPTNGDKDEGTVPYVRYSRTCDGGMPAWSLARDDHRPILLFFNLQNAALLRAAFRFS